MNNHANERANLFQLAFGQDQKQASYSPAKRLDWEMAPGKRPTPGLLGLLMAAHDQGIPFRELDDRLLEFVKPDKALAKELKKLDNETNTTHQERKQAFDAMRFQVDYLSELENAGLPAHMISDEFAKVAERFGLQAVMEQMQDQSPVLLARLQAREKATEVQAAQQFSEEETRADLAQAKSALDALRLDQLERMTEVDE